MAKASAAQLEDQSFEFALLLPDDDAGLAERSGALFEWCRGFLGAFGLAAGKDPPLSDESREALTDIARLAAASPQDDGDEEDEQALAEIEEFVRVATLLLHGDCALGPRHRKNLNCPARGRFEPDNPDNHGQQHIDTPDPACAAAKAADEPGWHRRHPPPPPRARARSQPRTTPPLPAGTRTSLTRQFSPNPYPHRDKP